MLITVRKFATVFAIAITPQIASAAGDIARVAVPTDRADLVLVDLDALTAQDKRRLTFYAEKIILGIKEISDLELAADADGVANKIDACRNLAGRFTTASQELGLTTDEARRYFLVQFVSTYTGRLPNAMVDDTGTFDLNALFSGNAEPPKPRPTNPDDIVDLLRNETIRGTATPN